MLYCTCEMVRGGSGDADNFDASRLGLGRHKSRVPIMNGFLLEYLPILLFIMIAAVLGLGC